MLAALVVASGLAVAAPPQLDCPTFKEAGFNPAGFEFEERSRDTRKIDIAADSEAARREAEAALYERLAGSLSEFAQKRLRRRIASRELGSAPLGGPRYRVCVAAFVDAPFVAQLEADEAALATSMDEIAAGAIRLAGGRPIAVATPTTPEGCPTDILGSSVLARMKRSLATRGASLAAASRACCRRRRRGRTRATASTARRRTC